MKKCTRCGMTKPFADFNRHRSTRDGMNCWCKACFLEQRRERRADPEYRARERAYLREWQRKPERRAKAAEYEQRSDVKERQRERSRLRRADPAHRHKIAARNAAAYALRTGVLNRQPCERCGADEVEAHHPDYAKPLEVIWLCEPCHENLHVEARAA